MDERWFIFVLKSNANLVINTTCMLLYLSRAIHIFECKTLVYKVYFWVSYFRPWFLWPETKNLVIPFLRIYLIASLLSVHCVSPHRRSHKTRWISTLKTKYHLLWLPLWPQPMLRMDRQFKEDRKMVPTLALKISSISPKEKCFRYLPYLYHLFARGRANI
jgi:hypothetical protein